MSRMMSKVGVWSLVGIIVPLVVGAGCGKQQVREEGTGSLVPQVERSESVAAGGSGTPQQAVRETPPARSGAEELAPLAPVPGGGLSQATSAALRRIHFDFDQALIRQDSRDVLGGNAAYLGNRPGTGVRIEGHCDERGTSEYNLALGERRAKASFEYLSDLGVSPSRMVVVSYGEESPLDSGRSDSAWAMNRRAEFVEF